MEATKRCPYCGEEILAAAIKCKHCKSDLSKGEQPATSPAPPTKPLIDNSVKVLGAVVISGLIIWWANYKGSETTPERPSADVPTSNERVPPVSIQTSRTQAAPIAPIQPPSIKLPSREANFIEAVAAAQNESRAAQNDMQRGGILAERDKAICAALTSLSVSNWIGKISKVNSNSDGKGVLAIKLAEGLTVATWNNELSDTFDETLIEPGTKLFADASAMTPGQQVTFSGTFVRSKESRCVEEKSLTLRGKIDDPEFTFKFSSVTTDVRAPTADAGLRSEAAIASEAQPNQSARPISALSPAAAGGPSFDCAKVRSQSEHLICADAELSDLDASLARTYRQAKERVTDKAAFIRESRSEWQRREACFDNACLFDWYDHRGNQLARLIMSTSTPEEVRNQNCRPLYDETPDALMERYRKIASSFANRHGETEQEFYNRIGDSPTNVAALAIAMENCGASIVDGLQSLDTLHRALHGASPLPNR
jgi:uncharacterized protein YecT (DUF1311 family)